jgi:hypothetical protein
VADFETAYNAFLGRLALTKFMVIPHYTCLVLKMPGPHGVISIRGDVKWAYDYDNESYQMLDRLAASTKLQELKQAMAESLQNCSCPTPRPQKSPSSRRTHSASRSRCLRRNLRRFLTYATPWIPNRNLRL